MLYCTMVRHDKTQINHVYCTWYSNIQNIGLLIIGYVWICYDCSYIHSCSIPVWLSLRRLLKEGSKTVNVWVELWPLRCPPFWAPNRFLSQNRTHGFYSHQHESPSFRHSMVASMCKHIIYIYYYDQLCIYIIIYVYIFIYIRMKIKHV